MIVQWILYNQCGTSCIDKNVDKVLYLNNDSSPVSPIGALHFHLLSRLYSYAIGYNFIIELANSWTDAQFHQVTNYKEFWIRYCLEHNISTIKVMESSEPFLQQFIIDIQQELAKKSIVVDIVPNNQFLISHDLFCKKYNKPPIMEYFYRRMRKKTGILMEGEIPCWGKRNYDKENRKFDSSFVDHEHCTFLPSEWRKKACNHYQAEVREYENRHGTLQQNYPTSRHESLSLLQYFVEHTIDRFGELEDAMYDTSDFVHHSLLSVSLNFWLLEPREVIDAIENAPTAINNKEWCIRQILGRREYMYHWYMFYKETIYEQNFFAHTKKIPDWFWWPQKTWVEMNCLNTVLKRVSRWGYSHHIERLMIVGNFSLLVWFHPQEVTKWFREQYVDAFERVVTPNVMGMSQFADGGNLATKPYVASANYVNKMSNYCAWCKYDPKQKYGPDACPLNYLYRNFINKHQEMLKKWRQRFIVNQLEKIDREAITKQSEDFIAKIW